MSRFTNTIITFQDVQTDPAQFVHIRMVDFGHESDLGSSHGILLWEEQLQFERPALKGRILRPGDHHMEIPSVSLIWLRSDSRHRLSQ